MLLFLFILEVLCGLLLGRIILDIGAKKMYFSITTWNRMCRIDVIFLPVFDKIHGLILGTWKLPWEAFKAMFILKNK